MTLVRFNNQPDISDVIDQLFKSQGHSVDSGHPLINIYGTDHSFVIEMAVPGYSKADFSISLEQQTLKVNAEAKESETKDEKFLRREFTFNGIRRSFSLPKGIDTDNIGADYQDGILKINLPRKQETILKKEISIA